MACTDQLINIESYLHGKLAGQELEQFEEHLFNCQLCFHELTLTQKMANLIKTEGHLLFAEDLQELEKAEGRPERSNARKSRWPLLAGFGTRIWTGLRGPKPAYGWAGIAVVAAIACFILIRPEITRQIPFVTREPALNPAGPEIQLLSPPNRGTVENTRPEFRWVGPADIATYYFVLFDEDGDIVWKQETVENRLVLADHIALQPNTPYFWQVEGKFESGSILPSTMARFTYLQK